MNRLTCDLIVESSADYPQSVQHLIGKVKVGEITPKQFAKQMRKLRVKAVEAEVVQPKPEQRPKLIVPHKDCSCTVCIHCGAHELVNCGHSTVNGAKLPVDEWRFAIRAHKVVDEQGSWSNCLSCNKWFLSHAINHINGRFEVTL